MKLVIENMQKKFDKKIILDNINYEFESGKIYGILGKNGSGKTTFFNCINKDEKTNKGKTYLMYEDKKEPLRYQNIGYLKSSPEVPEFLTAREFTDLFVKINAHKLEDEITIDDLLDEYLIEDNDKDKLLNDYSHGMKNKILMMINFISKPEILLLDEPLTSFDPLTASFMKKQLKKIKKESVIILSTHIMEVALEICDEILILNGSDFLKIDNKKLGKVKSEKEILKLLGEDDSE